MRRSAVFLTLYVLLAQISMVEAGTLCVPGQDVQGFTIIHDKTSGEGNDGGEQPEPEEEEEPDCD